MEEESSEKKIPKKEGVKRVRNFSSPSISVPVLIHKVLDLEVEYLEELTKGKSLEHGVFNLGQKVSQCVLFSKSTLKQKKTILEFLFRLLVDVYSEQG